MLAAGLGVQRWVPSAVCPCSLGQRLRCVVGGEVSSLSSPHCPGWPHGGLVLVALLICPCCRARPWAVVHQTLSGLVLFPPQGASRAADDAERERRDREERLRHSRNPATRGLPSTASGRLRGTQEAAPPTPLTPTSHTGECAWATASRQALRQPGVLFRTLIGLAAGASPLGVCCCARPRGQTTREQPRDWVRAWVPRGSAPLASPPPRDMNCVPCTANAWRLACGQSAHSPRTRISGCFLGPAH